MIQAVANATVPQITLIIGGSFGAGNYGMCGRSYDPRFVFAWPGSRIAVMGGEQAAKVMEIITVAKFARMGAQPDADAMAAMGKSIRDKLDAESTASTPPPACGTTASSTPATAARVLALPSPSAAIRRPHPPPQHLRRRPPVNPVKDHPDAVHRRARAPPQEPAQPSSTARSSPTPTQWEEDRIFPAHDLFKKLGNEGFLGLTKPEEYGGAGLDYSYAIVMAEELGRCTSGGVSLAIGVQTDMAPPRSPASAATSCAEFLAPSIAGDLVSCIGVSEVGSRLRRRHPSRPPPARTATTTSSTAARCGSPTASRPTGCAASPTPATGRPQEQVADHRPHEHQGRRARPQAAQARHVVQRHRPDLLRRRPRPPALPHRPEGPASCCRCCSSRRSACGAPPTASPPWTWRSTRPSNTPATARPSASRSSTTRSSTSAWPNCHRARVPCAPSSTAPPSCSSAGKDVTRLASMCKLKAGRLLREVSDSCLQYWGGMGYMWESKISRMFRDSRLASIGGGADEVMLSIICKLDGLLPGRARSPMPTTRLPDPASDPPAPPRRLAPTRHPEPPRVAQRHVVRDGPRAHRRLPRHRDDRSIRAVVLRGAAATSARRRYQGHGRRPQRRAGPRRPRPARPRQPQLRPMLRAASRPPPRPSSPSSRAPRWAAASACAASATWRSPTPTPSSACPRPASACRPRRSPRSSSAASA
jgi:citronellyl-CoA dehydrogenase